MGFFSFFRGGFDPSSYEREFSMLSTQISETQARIQRLQKLRATVKRHALVILFALYLVVTAYKVATVPKNTVGRNTIHRFVASQTPLTLFVLFVVYPSVLVLLLKTINGLFAWLIHSNNKWEDKLRRLRLSKIEELKRLTNYNTTNELLEKYDTEANLRKAKQLREKEERERQMANTKAQVKPAPKTKKVDPKMADLQRSGVSDKIFDLLIGSENNESVEKRYALICANCYTHNGLAAPNCKDPRTVKYMCMRCGFMNGEGQKNVESLNPKNVESGRSGENVESGRSGENLENLETIGENRESERIGENRESERIGENRESEKIGENRESKKIGENTESEKIGESLENLKNLENLKTLDNPLENLKNLKNLENPDGKNENAKSDVNDETGINNELGRTKELI